VTDLVNTYQQAGNFSTTWDGTNQSGAKVSSGTYFYQLRTDNGFVKTAKMVLLK
jgi:flagellar hook assembly protein FlgD